MDRQHFASIQTSCHWYLVFLVSKLEIFSVTFLCCWRFHTPPPPHALWLNTYLFDNAEHRKLTPELLPIARQENQWKRGMLLRGGGFAVSSGRPGIFQSTVGLSRPVCRSSEPLSCTPFFLLALCKCRGFVFSHPGCCADLLSLCFHQITHLLAFPWLTFLYSWDAT